MTNAYPNLEILKLTPYYHGLVDDSVLSALRFPNLTSLTLSNFQLGHGTFLLRVNVAAQSFYTYVLKLLYYKFADNQDESQT